MRRGQRTITALVTVTLFVSACSPAAGSAPTDVGGWADVLTGAADKLDVATTVAPISSIARNMGGDRIRLTD